MIITEVTEDQCDVQTQSNYDYFCKKDARGAYVFAFANKDALQLSEIYDYFSKFEDFISVQSAGDEKGLRFIRFKTFEAAKKAMDKTRKQPSINLIPYEKTKENTDWYPKKEQTTKKSEDEINLENAKGTSINKINEIRLLLIKKMTCKKRVRFETPEVGHEQKSDETIGNNKKTPTRCASADKEVIPLLASSAFEVIVANLHYSVGAAYVLHLLEKYEPLAVSYVKTVPYKNIRYCSVYFKTAVQAMKAERRLDCLDLNGNRLMVLRPSRL
ncbi:hypothetical protein TSAR_004716 [Trichomalopsis sarcophagae]|uniref:RRM domain-containing protein n=1 Tax=Trichomalopsis sarcophagae TaxID=543379 RepID=A0A232FLV9_9HYME|nr:hypothetical protein TSAR_004716 [Trichomalopsis sarcophagae]